MAADSIKTVGAPAKLMLKPDRTTLEADGNDVSCIEIDVCDADNSSIFTANNLVQFSRTGPGRSVGLAGGDSESLIRVDHLCVERQPQLLRLPPSRGWLSAGATFTHKAGVPKMKMTAVVRPAVLAAFLATNVVVTLHAQIKESPLPRLVQKDGRFALLVDDAPFLILAVEDQDIGLESTWPGRAKEWSAMDFLNANTVEVPIYWDEFEPQPGQFNYTSIDRLLAEARQHNVRLIPLWFATWKNGSQHYMPEWMLQAPDRYFHAVNRNGEAVDSPSPLATVSLEADKRAFAAFMRHLKEVDPQRTVIMVQVENEPGSWETVRDFSPAAQKVFEAPVPPEVLGAMHVKTAAPAPNWQEAFGPDADEYFHAWAVARYVGQVAAAGKAVYPLPMDANVAVRDPFSPGPAGQPGAPGNYESGGATDNVIPIWKVAAPAIDILGPDDYRADPAAYLISISISSPVFNWALIYLYLILLTRYFLVRFSFLIILPIVLTSILMFSFLNFQNNFFAPSLVSFLN